MYLDSAIIVKLLVREPDSLFYAEKVDGRDDLWASELAITECWSALCRKEVEGQISRRIRRYAWLEFESHISRDILLQPVTAAILREANLILEICAKNVPVRTLDAIHLATCQFLGAQPLMTNDIVMRNGANAIGLPLGPDAGQICW